MSTITFDTDELIQRLVDKQVPPEQARAIVQAIAAAQQQLATRRDLTELEHRLVIQVGAICASSIAVAVAVAAWMVVRLN